ncbi:MAG: hypothetical protein GEU98_05390 [Pseudonocardiaceae bacterium]|nr:hypothetical protein [Pseudonocardiaceae bacterium]
MYQSPGYVDPSTIKPTRLWFLVAGAIFVAGAVLATVFLAQAFSSFPKPAGELRSGESQTVHLDEEGITILTDRLAVNGRCTVTDSAGSEVPLTRPSTTETVRIGGTTWRVQLRSNEPVPPGDYQVECRASNDSVLFAAGPHKSVFGVAGRVLLAAGAGFLGFVIALVITIVVAVKRRNNKRRMQYGAYGQPRPYW